jgi:flagellar hook-associated protein 3 FlgL
MKVSTTLYFDNATTQLGNVQDQLSKTQEQLSTGKQIVRPSDAPDKASLVTRLNSELARQSSYQDTLKSVNTRLQYEETALTNTSDVLTKMKELAIQASSDTLSAADRLTISQQLSSLRDQALSLANSQDANGGYLFSGSRVNQPAFSADTKGQITYQGDQSRMNVSVGDSRRMNLNLPGSDVFSKVVRDDGNGAKTGVGFFQALDDLATAVKNSDHTNMQRGIAELDTLQQGVSNATAKVGSDMNVVDMQNTILDAITLNLKTIKSNAEDLDYTSAITKMNKDQLSLEAAQSSFAKISQLSLFKYMN